MSEIDLLSRAADAFEWRLAEVRSDEFGRPSPCSGWTVCDLVGHVVSECQVSARILRGSTGEEAIAGLDGDLLGGDPFAAFALAASAELEAFKEPEALKRIVHNGMRDLPAIQLLRSRIGDLTLHCWDLARSTGRDETLDPDLVQAVWAELSPMAPFIGQIGLFGTGPSGDLGEDAPLQLRLLDLSGRRPWLAET
jgi:uncharacterized protein (TIGR03086 family)